jgi:hypothetical protein
MNCKPGRRETICYGLFKLLRRYSPGVRALFIDQIDWALTASNVSVSA